MNLQDLIDSVDLLDYVSQYADFTEKNGEFWALSPLKEEDTPSFSVNREKNCFYDFSSGKGGNIFTFIKAYHHCGNAEAAEILRAYAGDAGPGPPRPKLEACRVAKRFSRRKKPQKTSKAAILPDDYMKRYEKRPDKLAIWRSEGISDASMERFSVYYDGFSDRIVYPIRNMDGKIINVSGRTVDGRWKEKKLRKYTYFKPLGALDTVYGAAENMEWIREKGEIILFEGAKSVLLADTWGIRNTGALLTSHLNPCQLKILIRLGCTAVFALDKEIDVREDENIRRLTRYVPVEYVWDRNNLLQAKMSPVDAGREVWETLYRERRRLR